jgi:hypothetical protein
MSDTTFDWESPPLSPEDLRLAEAYRELGIPLDALVYTEAFEELCERLHGNRDRSTLRSVYVRLIGLRKRARLPLLGRSPV